MQCFAKVCLSWRFPGLPSSYIYWNIGFILMLELKCARADRLDGAPSISRLRDLALAKQPLNPRYGPVVCLR